MTETKFIKLKDVRNGKKYEFEFYAEVCPNCKEQYYDADTLIKLEKAADKDSVKKAA